MKRLATFLLAVGLAFVLAMPASAQQFFPYQVEDHTLDNGLRVLLIPMSAGGLVAYYTVVRTGARDEYEPGRTGFAHFFEHMMFRGTEKYPAAEYKDITTKIGADTNASTGEDITQYYLSIAAEDLDQVMEIESDRFMNLNYPVDMFETEAGAIYGEYRKNRMNPFFLAYEAVRKEAFEVHTYGHTAMGFEEDIKNMPKMFDYSRTFFDRYYRPENIVLMIIGDIDAASTLEKVKQYYGGWEKGYQEPPIPAEPEQTTERRIEVEYPGSTLPMIWNAFKAPAFDPSSKNYVAGMLLCDLAFGETSDIYKKLVLDEQVVDILQAGLNFNRDPGLIDLIARVKDEDKIDYVQSELDRVIAKVRETPPSAESLADLKSRQKYDFLMGLDTPMAVARSLSQFIAITGSHEAIDTLYNTMNEVTPEDVATAAREYFVTEKRTIAVLKGAR